MNGTQDWRYSLEWEPARARCTHCGCVVPQSKMILGKENPLGPEEHYCRDCAKALNVRDEEVRHSGA